MSMSFDPFPARPSASYGPPPPPPNPYATAAYSCPSCGGNPVGGYLGTLEHVQQASAHAGVVWARVAGHTRPFCGPNCHKDYAANAPRTGQPEAARVEPELPQAYPPPKPSVERRESRIRCGSCPSEMLIDQSRRPGAEWAPAVSQIADAAGWRRVGGGWYCGRTCAPVPVQAPTPPVTTLPDASYQARRAQPAVIEDREIRPGKGRR
jgi:hypothetical protein